MTSACWNLLNQSHLVFVISAWHAAPFTHLLAPFAPFSIPSTVEIFIQHHPLAWCVQITFHQSSVAIHVGLVVPLSLHTPSNDHRSAHLAISAGSTALLPIIKQRSWLTNMDHPSNVCNIDSGPKRTGGHDRIAMLFGRESMEYTRLVLGVMEICFTTNGFRQ